MHNQKSSHSFNKSPSVSTNTNKYPNYGFGTLSIHYAQEPEQTTGAVIPPIFLSSTYAQEPYVGHKGYEYSRSGNPNRNSLEKSLAKLENGKHAFLFSSGLAATSTFFNIFPQSSDVVLNDDIYGGTFRYLNSVATHLNVNLKIADLTSEKEARAAITNETTVVFFETPTNPSMRIIDIKKLISISKEANPDIIVAVDNTLLTPFFQNPLDLGADVVIHSITKFINGHSDVVMGALVTNNDKLAEKFGFYQNSVGSVPSPFDCYLAHRGLKTLHLRMKRSEENAIAIAKLLQSSDNVLSVNFSGLSTDSNHILAKKQQRGFGGILSFTLKGTKENAATFLSNLKLFYYAESLGGIESLIEIPAIMTHASIPVEKRRALGITDNFIRLSAGIEDTEDLLNDIEYALNAAYNDNMHPL